MPLKHINEGPMRPLQWFALGICMVINMLDGFDILAMSYTAPVIKEELALSPAELGSLFSSALVGMMFGSFFLAPLSDTFGRRLALIGALIIISLSMIATGYAEGLIPMLLARFITGLGIGSILASLTSMVAEYTPEKWRNMSVTMMLAGYPLGAVVGGLLAAPLLPLVGWRVIFIGSGVVTLVLAAGVLLALPESLEFLLNKQPAGALKKVNHLLAKLRAEPLSQLPQRPRRAEGAHVLSLLTAKRRSKTILLWLAFLTAFATLYFLLSWIPSMLKDAGLSLSISIYAGTIINLGGVLGLAVLGYLSIHFGLSRMIASFLGLSALSMLVFSAMPTTTMPPFLLLSVAGVIGFFLLGASAGFYAMAARLYPSEIRTTGIGWAIGLARSGAIAGPLVTGWLIAQGFTLSENLIIWSIPLVLSALITLRLKV